MNGIEYSEIIALVEICLMDGYPFGSITKEIRNEWRNFSMRDSLTAGAKAINDIASGTSALAATARRAWDEWREKYPNLDLGFNNGN